MSRFANRLALVVHGVRNVRRAWERMWKPFAAFSAAVASVFLAGRWTVGPDLDRANARANEAKERCEDLEREKRDLLQEAMALRELQARSGEVTWVEPSANRRSVTLTNADGSQRILDGAHFDDVTCAVLNRGVEGPEVLIGMGRAARSHDRGQVLRYVRSACGQWVRGNFDWPREPLVLQTDRNKPRDQRRVCRLSVRSLQVADFLPKRAGLELLVVMNGEFLGSWIRLVDSNTGEQLVDGLWHTGSVGPAIWDAPRGELVFLANNNCLDTRDQLPPGRWDVVAFSINPERLCGRSPIGETVVANDIPVPFDVAKTEVASFNWYKRIPDGMACALHPGDYLSHAPAEAALTLEGDGRVTWLSSSGEEVAAYGEPIQLQPVTPR